jgi:solute carrier family 25 carnitine/acylcarnitine transporter 20/29
MSDTLPTLNAPPPSTITWSGLRDELVYGSFAGLGICLAGHPFDTTKTRMQMENTGIFKTVRTTLAKEGPTGFYKGIGGPILAIPF